MSDLKPGDFIAGEYRIKRVFGGQGKSGMGVVYLVEGRTSEEPFVLKTFQSKRANQFAMARFKAEAETWINIGKHPNIVQCQWVREFSDQLFVAAEYIWPDDVGRNSLTQHLEVGGQTLRQQLNWIAHFCFGMKHAMAHGMKAHRDIKPDNLMVDNRGRLKITDFGLAKGLALVEPGDTSEASASSDDRLTVVGTAFGTPPFMSPEQFVDSSAVDHRVDIYSLGVVIYMLISGGRMPIVVTKRSDDYFRQWALAHSQQRIVKLDHPLMHFADKCLEKNPDRRFQSYDELLAAVEQSCRSHGFPIPQDSQDTRAEFERQWGIAMSLSNLGRAEEAVTKLRTMAERWPDASEVFTELGVAYIRLGNYPEALKAEEQSLKLSPYSTAAWNNLGGILTNLERCAEAKNAYRKALEIEPENTGAMIGLAQLLVTDGEMDEAKKWCELAVFWRPEKPNVLAVASTCLMQCGEAKPAAILLEKLVHLPPDSKGLVSGFDQRTSWFNLALCRQTLGETEACMHAFREVLKRDPKNAKALGFLAQTLVQIGRVDEALPYLDKSLAYDPQFYPAWITKGNALDMLGRGEEALRCYDQALAIDSRNTSALGNKGITLEALGRHADALDCYDRALQINSRDTKVWRNKGNVLGNLKRYQDALVCFQEAHKLGDPNAEEYVEQCRSLLRFSEDRPESSAVNTNSAQEYFSKAADLAKLGKHAEAVSCYETGLRLDPKNAAAWFNMGHSIGFLGRHQDVVKCCDRALEINPHFPPLWILKGLGLLSMERFRDAMDCFQQAEKLGDASAAGHMARCRMAHAEWYFRLGSQYQQEGNNAEAINCYEKGLALNPVGNAIIWSNKGAALLALKRGQEAVVCFDRAIALDPRDASAWNNKGCALLAIGKQFEAMACLQEAKRLRT
jgi:tetratricopeptide (TPR) repeat protein